MPHRLRRTEAGVVAVAFVVLVGRREDAHTQYESAYFEDLFVDRVDAARVVAAAVALDSRHPVDRRY
jgi:hypothetical protein